MMCHAKSLFMIIVIYMLVIIPAVTVIRLWSLTYTVGFEGNHSLFIRATLYEWLIVQHRAGKSRDMHTTMESSAFVALWAKRIDVQDLIE